MDRGALWATVHGVTKESDMSERLHVTLHVLAATIASTCMALTLCKAPPQERYTRSYFTFTKTLTSSNYYYYS